MALICRCCGRWRIEVISLDGQARYKVTADNYLAAGDGYPATPEALRALLERARGPELGDFVDE